jgi:hypothetical protein
LTVSDVAAGGRELRLAGRLDAYSIAGVGTTRSSRWLRPWRAIVIKHRASIIATARASRC